MPHEAQTWFWPNKAKTRLRDVNVGKGYIEVGSADGVLVAQVYVKDSDPYSLTEKFVGRCVAWFERDLFSINIQFMTTAKNAHTEWGELSVGRRRSVAWVVNQKQ